MLTVEALSRGKNNDAKRSFLAADKEKHNAIQIYNKLRFQHKDEIGQINMALVL